MELSLVLPVRNQAELSSFLKSLYDPSSPDYRHFLSVAEFADRFGPTSDDYQAAVAFAKAQGFTVKSQSANRLLVPIEGTVGQVQNAFKVKMQRYEHPAEAREFFSPDREPTVPAGLPVRHISGLNNYSQPMSMARRSPTGIKGTDVQGSGPAGNYMASDMRAAYYGGAALTGQGQTLGLVQFDGYNIADVISAFNGAATLGASGADSVVNYTPPGSQTAYAIPVHNVLLDQATGAPGQFISPTDDGEQVLDIAQSIGMAPGLSQVRVYIGKSDVDVLSAIASEKLADEVSISWSWTPDDPTIVDQFLQEMAAQGQSVFVASGDYGAYSPVKSYYFPAEDQWVTAVGGTHLTTDGAGGPFMVETAWNQSGGGVSPDDLPIPSWQVGVSDSANLASTTLRNIPDVAMEADFDNFNCDMGNCSGGWAGTSFASPRWAAFTALVNEQALSAGDPQAGFLNPVIYATGQGSNYGSQFHDVDSGQNNFEPGYGFYAVPGYDLVTGWGSPTGQNLIDALAPKSSVGFKLTTTQSGLTISPGSSATTTIGVVYVGGFSGNVSLAVTSALPSGVSASFSANSTSSTSVLTLTLDILTAAQSFGVTVTGTSGNVLATTYLTVNIPTNAVAVLSPVTPAVPVTAQELKPGALVSIGGTILGNPQSIQLQWAPGVNPASGWTSQGVTQSAGLTPPFSNQTVGSWDTSSITVAGYYSIQLSAIYADGTVSATSLVYLEPALLSSKWPQWIDTAPEVDIAGSGIVPVDDGSGNTGLAFIEPTYLGATNAAPRYRVFSPDGSTDHSVALTYGSYPSPAFGHLTPGDKGTAIMGDARNLLLLDSDTTKSSFPLGGANVDFTVSQAVLADLKGDSTLATIAYGDQCWNNLAFVYAWDSNKQSLNSNFPIQVPCENGNALFWNPGIAVGDIDGDGKQEIIALELPTPTTFTFGLFANDGTPRSWSAPTFNGIPERMILVDLDGNGKLELVVGVNPANTNSFMLHVLQPDGTERNGWPVQMPGLPSLAAGDLARTGVEQIVVSASDKLLVLNGDGTSFSPAWPVTTNLFSLFGPVVLADIDGDGYPEIVVANGNYSSPNGTGLPSTIPSTYFPSSPTASAFMTSARLQTGDSDSSSTSPYFEPVVQAFHRDGTVVRSWHIPSMHGEQPWWVAGLAVGDFNHDGITDIAVVDGLISGGGSSGAISEGTMEVLTTGSAFNPSANDWPMANHDTYNSASAYPQTVNSPQTKVPAFSLPSGAYPPPLTITIGDTTPGATIYYTTNGTTPTTSSTPYSAPITVSAAETIQAIATANGYSTSAVASSAYTLSNPVPVTSYSSPGFASAGGSALTLTINGSGFIASSTAYWGTSALPTKYLSATQLTAQVTAAQIASAGTTAVTVQTPSPGGGTSNPLQFEVDSAGSAATAPAFTSTTATVAAGSTASFAVTLPSTVTSATVTCLNLPKGAACSYSSTTSTVTISTSSTTPSGTYQITVVFSETLPGAATAGILLPFLLLPLLLLRKRLGMLGSWPTACLGLVLLAAASFGIGCGGGGSGATTAPPTNQTHQVTSSASVILTVQ